MPLFLVIRKEGKDLIPSLENLSKAEDVLAADEVMFCRPIPNWSEDQEELAEFEGFLKILLGLDLFFNGINRILEEALDIGLEIGKRGKKAA